MGQQDYMRGKRWTSVMVTVVFFVVVLLLPGTTSRAVNKTAENWGKTPIHLEQGTDYHAYLVFQAKESWTCRYFPYDDALGVENEELWNRVWTTCNRDQAEAVSGDIEDAVIRGNGHYTVKVSNLNGALTAETAGGEPVFGILAIATDIPKDYRITFDHVTVSIDGVEVGTVSNAQLYYDRDFTEDPGVFCIDLINTWHEECRDMPANLPQDTMEIGFDVTGFQYDNPDAAVQTQKPEKAESRHVTEKSEKKDKGSSQMVVGVFVTIAAIAGLIVLCVAIIFILRGIRRSGKK